MKSGKQRLTGYHYTSLENWNKIKQFGIKPYLIKKDEWKTYFPGGVYGVWIWENELEGLSHAGTIIFQVQSKASTDIVKLKVHYNERAILKWNGRRVSVEHYGSLNNFIYHEDEPALISTQPIPPCDVELIGTYNIVKLLA